MHRLQTIASIRQCPAHDHAHRVVEIRPAHLVDNSYRRNGISGPGSPSGIGFRCHESIVGEQRGELDPQGKTAVKLHLERYFVVVIVWRVFSTYPTGGRGTAPAWHILSVPVVITALIQDDDPAPKSLQRNFGSESVVA